MLVPVLVVVSCSALFVGGVNAVQDQRAGGTLPIGQTFTYKSGLAVGVSDVAPTKVSNTYIVDKTETAYQGVVTIVNGTNTSASTALVTINITVGSVAAERVFDDGLPPTQDLAPGQQAKMPFKFKVKKGTNGPLQISVSPSLDEPVFFTGLLK